MHDFIQNLSFSSQSPFLAARAASEVLSSLTRSFNETPAYRPAPRATKRRKSRPGSTSLSPQLSALS